MWFVGGSNLTPAKESEAAIEVRDGNYRWTASGAVNLHDINVSVTKGELVTIIGATGSGKSSLLSCILGEMLGTCANLRRTLVAVVVFAYKD